MPINSKIHGDIKRALKNRFDLNKENPKGHLQGHVNNIKQLVKDVNEQLEPIKEAMVVLKGYAKECEAKLSENQQLSIFDMV